MVYWTPSLIQTPARPLIAMQNHLRLLFAVVLAVLSLAGASASAAEAPYLLGPQDKLKIRVYDWRTGSGDTHEWTAVTGEFVVGPSGHVSLPFVGEVLALDKTTGQLAQLVSDQLKLKVGLSQAPFTSVEISQYRPFYILGLVEKPGEYAFRPGMTVLNAVGIAGGRLKVADMSLLGYERDALVNRGELRALTVERLQLLAKQARLKAEVEDADTVAFPSEIEAHKGEPVIARTMKEEALLLAGYRNSLRTQDAVLTQTKTLFEHEIATLDTKDAALGRQVDFAKKELDTVNTLVLKGLSIAPRQTALQQNEAQFESARLDVQLATLRAREDIARADRDNLEYRNKARSQALDEAGEVRTRLAGITERIETAESLIYQAEVRSPEVTAATADRADAALIYFVTRKVGGSFTTTVTEENDLVRPGDTIRVEHSPRRTDTASEGAIR